MRHHFALVACLAFTGSVVQAEPKQRSRPAEAAKKSAKAKAKQRVKVAPPVELPYADDEGDDDEEEAEAPRRKQRSGQARKRAPAAEDADGDRERIALRAEAPDDEDAVDPPVRLRESRTPKRAKDWHVAIGPYLWASAVDADVSLGPASVSAGVDFFELERHARYGAEVLAEVRYGKLALYGDLMYGVVDVGGDTTVGPLMVSLRGTASSLLVDGMAGYLLAGGEQSVLSLEARTGVRYQRTAISGSVNVAGAEVSPSDQISAAADALAGAHVVVRPCSWFSVSGAFDLGVFGSSTSTWSATTDASVRIKSRVRLSLGWRTLTMERANVSIVLHGPRAAVQLVF